MKFEIHPLSHADVFLQGAVHPAQADIAHPPFRQRDGGGFAQERPKVHIEGDPRSTASDFAVRSCTPGRHIIGELYAS